MPPFQCRVTLKYVYSPLTENTFTVPLKKVRLQSFKENTLQFLLRKHVYSPFKENTFTVPLKKIRLQSL